MIPRRTTNNAAPPSPVFEPWDPSGELPPWSPPTPPGGWTPEAAFTAAIDYADAVVDDVEPRYSRIVGAAYRAILSSSFSLKRAQIAERRSGVDRYAEHFDERLAPAEESDPAPF